MLDIMENSWKELTMEFSLAILCWIEMIEPLSVIDSIKTTVRKVKEILNLAEERFERIFDCETAQFDELRRMAIKSEYWQTVKDVLEHFEYQWKNATDKQKEQLDRMTVRAFRSEHVKFRKDALKIAMKSFRCQTSTRNHFCSLQAQ